MRNLVTNIFLAAIWIALTMKFNFANIFFGLALGYFVLWFINRNNKNERYFKRIPALFSYMFLFIKEVIKGSLIIGYDIITPKHNMHPGIVAVPLTAKTDLEITLLANSITLTPGTTSLALSDDKSILYVYSVYLDADPNKTIAEIKNGLEHKLLEVLR